MAELSLPKEVNYATPLPVLPEGAFSTLMSVQPTNGISFSPSQVIQFDLNASLGNYIDPKSVFIRFKAVCTSGATQGIVRRKPAYTFITRLDEFIGSVPVNSVYQYNLVANGYIDTNFSITDVLGQAFSFGLQGNASAYTDIDGFPLPTASGDSSVLCAAPLVCSALSGLSNFYPTSASAPWRIQLTVAPISEAFTVPANVTAYRIENPELCFQMITLGSNVDNLVMSMAPKIRLHTTGWASASQTIAQGTSGYQSLPFNHRYESLTNLYLYSTVSDTTKAINSWGDSFNPLGTAGANGTCQIQINNQLVPQIPINNNTGGLASVLQFLRMSNSGSITDQRNTMSILTENYNQYAGDATVSTSNLPAKFILGFPLTKVVSSPYAPTSLLSGVSAAQSPINVLLNIGTALNKATNFFLVAQYDEIIEIDTMSKQVNIIC